MKFMSERAALLHNAGILTEEKAQSYDEFFKDAAQKMGVDPENMDDVSDEKKKKFFDYVDKNWDAEDEGKVDESDDSEFNFNEIVNPTIYGGGTNFGMLKIGDKFKFKSTDNDIFTKISKRKYTNLKGNSFQTSSKSGVCSV